MKVPHLFKKIELLLLHHRTVRTKAALADHIGISQGNISVWMNGDGTDENKGDRIPDKHVKKFCDLFQIETRWLKLEDQAQFETYLLQNTQKTSRLHELLAHRDNGNAIKLIRCPSEDDPPKLSYEDELESLADRYFPQFQRVYIEINLKKLEKPIEIYPQTLTLINAGSTYKCLCPAQHDKAPSTLIQEPGKILIPTMAPKMALKTDEVGSHYLAAIFTDLPLSPELSASLSDPHAIDLKPALDALATSLLEDPKQAWRVLYWNYHVYVGNERTPF